MPGKEDGSYCGKGIPLLQWLWVFPRTALSSKVTITNYQSIINSHCKMWSFDLCVYFLFDMVTFLRPRAVINFVCVCLF